MTQLPKSFFRRFLRHFKKELLIVKHNWAVVALTLFFNYVHAVAHNLAYYLHMPSEPLFDLAFALLPSLKKEVQIVSEVAFFCFLTVSILFLLSPLYHQNHATYSKCIDSVDADSLEELYIKPTQPKTNILSMLSRTFDFSAGYNFSFSTFSQQYLTSAPLSMVQSSSFSKDDGSLSQPNSASPITLSPNRRGDSLPPVSDSATMDDDLNTFPDPYQTTLPQTRLPHIDHQQQIQMTSFTPYPPPHTPPANHDVTHHHHHHHHHHHNNNNNNSLNHYMTSNSPIPSASNPVKQSTLTLLQSSRSGTHQNQLTDPHHNPNNNTPHNPHHPHNQHTPHNPHNPLYLATTPHPSNLDHSSDSSSSKSKSARSSGSNLQSAPNTTAPHTDSPSSSSKTHPITTTTTTTNTTTTVTNAMKSSLRDTRHPSALNSINNVPYQDDLHEPTQFRFKSAFAGLKTVQFNSKITGLSPPMYSFQMLIRILCVLSLSQALRASCFSMTALPGPNYHCRPYSELYSPPRDIKDLFFRSDAFFSCGDLVFSSHTTFMLSFALVYTHYGSFKSLKYGVWTFIVTFCLLVLAARKHYAIDIWIACYTVPLIWNIFAIYCPDEIPVEVARMELEEMHDMIQSR